jgi:hypothetical protein
VKQNWNIEFHSWKPGAFFLIGTLQIRQIFATIFSTPDLLRTFFKFLYPEHFILSGHFFSYARTLQMGLIFTKEICRQINRVFRSKHISKLRKRKSNHLYQIDYLHQNQSLMNQLHLKFSPAHQNGLVALLHHGEPAVGPFPPSETEKPFAGPCTD